MEILTAKEMREIDRKAIEDYGIPGTLLMENAGIQTTIALEEKLHNLSQQRVAVFAGKGNNGGDGAVVARHLYNKGVKVEIFLFAKKKDVSPDSMININIAEKMGIPVYEIESYDHLKSFKKQLIHTHIFIDALLGTGIKPPVKGTLKQVISYLNDLNKFILSIDIPSGLSSDHGNVEGEVIRANMTTTFCRPKRCHFLYPAAEYVGELKIVDISIPDKVVRDGNIKVHTVDKEDIRFLFNKRKPDSHKGTYGHLLVLGGSTGKGGAAAMASLSALRIGTGLVTTAVPESVNASIETSPLEIMSIPLPETGQGSIDIAAKNTIIESLKNKSAVLIGPGISTHPKTTELLLKIIPEIKIPLIIDADGLNCLSGHLDVLRKLKGPVVITPHPGEMSRLIKKPVNEIQADRIGIAQKFASDYNVFVILKGAGTIIAFPDRDTFINITGNPGMATAGTGDVLAGMVGGLIAQSGQWPQPNGATAPNLRTKNFAKKAQFYKFAAQKVSLSDALKVAVFVHGLAGDIAAQKKGQISLIASDLIDEIPEILQSC